MTLGLEWIESTPATGDLANDEARMYFSGDPCRYVLTRRTVALPGQQFFYSTGALALVSAIVHRATGRPLDEFARASLLEPLGIAGEEWSRMGRDSDTGGGLRMRPRDALKPLFNTLHHHRRTMKSFTHFLTDLNDGQTQAALTADLDELLRTVKATGRSGALSIKLKVQPASKGGHEVDNITIPKEFELGLRLFKNGDGYKLKARLKYRLVQGGIKFWYELDRPERAIEDAFNGYIDKVKAESGYTVLVGSP